MQPRERIDVRQRFEEDNLNILVATSVAEEGLDIQACNMVIRYMYIKDMIAKIQSKGMCMFNIIIMQMLEIGTMKFYSMGIKIILGVVFYTSLKLCKYLWSSSKVFKTNATKHNILNTYFLNFIHKGSVVWHSVNKLYSRIVLEKTKMGLLDIKS